VTIDGLPLWAPPTRARVSSLPFEAMLHSREVAVGGVMIDIGANVGQTSIPRAILGDYAVAYALEPEPLNFACLQANVRDHGLQDRVVPVQVAVGDRTGTVSFRQTRQSKSHSVAVAEGADTIPVACTTVDAWLAERGVPASGVSFIKSDTNGFELQVLAGSRELLMLRRAVWQIEVAPECLATFGASIDALGAAAAEWFTCFIDCGRKATGDRVRPMREWNEALAYLLTIERHGKAPITDTLLLPFGTPAASPVRDQSVPPA
jgi:FkbM family methyltransferase